MNITDVRKKKKAKKEELDGLKKELKAVPVINYVFLGIIVLIVGLVITSSIVYHKTDNVISDNDSVVACNKSQECVNSCINYYEGDSVNHSLECDYKCLTYKYCD